MRSYPKILPSRKRRIRRRLDHKRGWSDQAAPIMRASNIHYEWPRTPGRRRAKAVRQMGKGSSMSDRTRHQGSDRPKLAARRAKRPSDHSWPQSSWLRKHTVAYSTLYRPCVRGSNLAWNTTPPQHLCAGRLSLVISDDRDRTDRLNRGSRSKPCAVRRPRRESDKATATACSSVARISADCIRKEY
jgi:hypothetical protein